VAQAFSLCCTGWKAGATIGEIIAFHRSLTAGATMARAKILIPKERLAEFCRKHRIKKLALFGSVLREDFKSDSDVDVLVEFESGHVPGLAFFAMEEELSKILGRKVDLHTPAFLSRYFRDMVMKEAEVQYVAA
jgi:hypothetical protein